MGELNSNTPWKLIGLVTVLAIALSFLPKEQSVFNVNLKHVDVLANLKIDEANSDFNDSGMEDSDYEDYMKDYQELIEEDSTSTDKQKETLNFEISKSDAINLASFSIFNFIGEIPGHNLSGRNKARAGIKRQKITGNTKQLRSFFAALSKSDFQKVRIAHFGDSAIEGDLITADIREALQAKFGGEGVGWISITSQDVSFRLSTKQSFSGNWEEAAVYSSNPNRLPFGISGEVFVPKSDSWIEYETTRFYPHTRALKTVSLYYSNAGGESIKYSFDGGNSQSAITGTGNDVKELVFESENEAKKIKISVPGSDTHYYGVSLENGPGIYVDNLPLRGNSGVDISQIDKSKLKDFAKLRNYDLFVLEFGLNALGMIKRNYNWYVREMIKAIKHLKKAYPNAAFLLVGAHDKSIKKNGKFVTDPAIFRLLKAQLKIVKETNVAFWNLFEAMGGKDSMHDWVTNNPPLASHDHLHFNWEGGKVIGEIFAEALLREK